MATTTKILTAEEFMRRYAGSGSYELIGGEVAELSPGNIEHGIICFNIGGILRDYGRRTGYGYVTGVDAAVVTARDPDTVRGADVAFYSHVRFPRDLAGTGLAPIAPDLVVEVYSPSNRPGEMRAKVNEYLTAGALMVWVVDPARRQVAVYRPEEPIPSVLGEADVVGDLPELPGFQCPVAEFFA